MATRRLPFWAILPCKATPHWAAACSWRRSWSLTLPRSAYRPAALVRLVKKGTYKHKWPPRGIMPCRRHCIIARPSSVSVFYAKFAPCPLLVARRGSPLTDARTTISLFHLGGPDGRCDRHPTTATSDRLKIRLYSQSDSRTDQARHTQSS